MAIPDFQTVMLPVLELASDREPHRLRDAVDTIAVRFGLSDPERAERLPSGTQTVIHNRVGWASTYLRKAGLLTQAGRGVFRITDLGLEVLGRKPTRIDVRYLHEFPGYLEFKALSRRSRDAADGDEADDAEVASGETPEEALERAHASMRGALAQEILARLAQVSPGFFERIVIEVLVQMGYGGSIREAGQRLGRTGDGGIDGIIKEDRLGLDVIYLQAKRWQAVVGRPEIQQFVGALQGNRARKGVFITTSTFSEHAREYAAHIDPKVVLIDGAKLAELMMDFDVGVSTVATYAVKRVDSDYFEEA